NNETLSVKDKQGRAHTVDALDVVATLRNDGVIAVSAVNKDAENSRTLTLSVPGAKKYRVHTLNGESTESYNDIGVNGIVLRDGEWTDCGGEISIDLEAHSVNIIEIEQ
ncbi:MAG: alpha-N-arabinofuranosidase, partial [Clostridia bacterium]|nr:alpha-N-arabinofuranosidase [Clostridia bacterium]